MPDPATAIERIGETALVVKMLGPTADYIGQGVREWTERAAGNVHNIFEKAAYKLGPELEEDGAVPPRVLKGILEQGQFCDDELPVPRELRRSHLDLRGDWRDRSEPS